MKFAFSPIVAAIGLLTFCQAAPKRADEVQIDKVEIKYIDLDFTKGDAYSPLASSDSVTVKYTASAELGDVSVLKFQSGTTLKYENDDLATIQLSQENPENPAKGVVAIKFKNVPLVGAADKHAQIRNILKKFTTDALVTSVLHGSANVVAKTSSGERLFNNLQVPPSQLPLKGMSGLTSVPLKVDSVKVVGGTADGIQIDMASTLQNPSDIALNLGDVSFGVHFQEKNIGGLSLKALELKRGENKLTGRFVLNPKGDSAAAGEKALENFLEGITSDMLVVGSKDSTPIESLKDGLDTLRIPAAVPGVTEKLIRNATAVASIDAIIDKKTNSTVVLYNPIDTAFTITHMKANITYQNGPLGEVDQDTNMTIPSHQEQKSQILETKLTAPDEVLIDILNNHPEGIEVDLDSVVTARIGDFVARIPYKQKNVHLNFSTDPFNAQRKNQKKKAPSKAKPTRGSA
ncbi:uncharacterized protein VTP21DRAFT_1131 [Calcarisporiella thermophila]|uniref:uncharacterized protein n=1 Tax=Calcarisporiella thermophila TaxID=911321 RepID=UPI003742FA4D